MASIIRIKRSSSAGNPSILAAGELAYSALTNDDTNGGDRLYIGVGLETEGNAANHFVIGGKYFTDLMDHARGTLTADSAILVDENKKINELFVDNLGFDGNTISTTEIDLNLLLAPNNNGLIELKTNTTIIGKDDNATITTSGLYDLTLSTNSGTNSGTIVIEDGADGNIILTPNGNGVVDINNVDIDGGDIDNVRLGVGTPITEATIDNVKIDGNTISTVDTNGDLIVQPDGIGKTVTYNLHINDGVEERSIEEYIQDITGGQILGTAGVISATYDDGAGTTTLDLVETGVSAGSYGSTTAIPTFTVDTDGRITNASTVDVATVLNITGDSGTAAVNLLDDSVLFTGVFPLSTEVSSDSDGENIVTFNIANATSSTVGVASFDSTDFTVTAANVTVNTITLGSSSLNPGETTLSLAGLQSVDVDNIKIDGNEISSTDTDGNILLSPNGNGYIEVNDSLIRGVSNPTDDQDAATKIYVDTVAQGLRALPEAKVATTDDSDEYLDATYETDSEGISTLTSNINEVFPVIDGYQLQVGENILVKNQDNKWENGSYVLTDFGSETTPWVLTRCSFCDETQEVPGAFEFVSYGTQYANTGWVATVPANFELGATDGRGDITWVQFSGAGAYLAGDGLTRNGVTFDVVGTPDRITVNPDSVDIASTYVGQTSITTLGTITTGIWQGTILNPTYGGTGVNNGNSTITLNSGDFEIFDEDSDGDSTLTLLIAGDTEVNLPNSGILATLANAETLTNKTIESSNIGVTAPGTGNFTTLEADNLQITDTTEATSAVTGALTVAGGVGVVKDIYVGQDIVGSGPATSFIDGFDIDGGTY